MNKSKVKVMIFLASLLGVFFNFPVFAATASEYLLSENVSNRGMMITFEGGELHLPPGSVLPETKLTIREEGIFKKLVSAGIIPKINDDFRSRYSVYTYSFSQPLQKEVIWRLNYDPEVKPTIKKRIFFTNSFGGEWVKKQTVVNNDNYFGQVSIKDNFGSFVLANHVYLEETPVKKMTFMSFAGIAHSRAAAVIDAKSGKFLYTNEAREQRSIASLTKLITTLVFLESQPNLDALKSYDSHFNRHGVNAALEVGDQLSLKQILMGALIPSANNMAAMLRESTTYSPEQFDEQVKGRLDELGLKKTVYTEPTGLDSSNISSAGNLARLARTLFGEFPDIFYEAAQANIYSYTTFNTQREIKLYTTNRFDDANRYEVRAFKTGYLPGTADRTLIIDILEKSTGYEIIVVLLGNDHYGEIFNEAKEVADWVFDNWIFHNY